ncbi:MAG: hypothetical protein A3F11_11895 [Gammaproteobacteria bacterium RIFCSPHIGHO2_12_FULL_37_14]|nr:MAG: hypothetical protein A3F11_11895 [Gammaproteobacteria bacterium RIFCSPHIGHO2_12_FULL_37_14]
MDDIFRGRQIIARLDRLPIWPYPRYFLFIIGIGFFFAFFDTLTIGLALPRIEIAFGVNLQQATWTITSSLVGYIIGAFIIGYFSDKFGRKLGLILSISLFTLGSFACAISLDLSWLIFWRFITGMGIGAELIIVTSMMEELSPAMIRGRSTSIAIAFGMFGFAIAPFIAYFLVPQFANGWRILFALGGIGGVFIGITRSVLPDSPRWLVLQNEFDRAEKIVLAAEQQVRQQWGQELPIPKHIDHHQPLIRDSSLENFFHPPILKRVFQFSLLWFIYYIGNYAWLTLAPSLLIKQGFTLASSIGFVAIASFGFVIGSLLTVILSELFERKWLAVILMFIWAATLFVIAWFPNPTIIMVAGFIATTTIAMTIPILYIYTGENFPTHIRATSLAVTDGLGHLGGAFCGQIIFFISNLTIANSYNFHSAFTIMAITGVITAFLLIPGLMMTHRSLND